MSEFNDRIDRLYAREKWASLARLCGLRPSETEGQARHALSFAARAIEKMEDLLTGLEGQILSAAERTNDADMARRLERVSRDIMDDRKMRQAHSGEHFPVFRAAMADVSDVKIDTIRRRLPIRVRGTVDGQPFLLHDDGRTWTLAVGGEVDTRPDWTWTETRSGADARADTPGSAPHSRLSMHWQNTLIRRQVMKGCRMNALRRSMAQEEPESRGLEAAP